MAHRFFQVAFFAFLSSGCATIFAGKGSKVLIDTDPQGARVLVNGLDRGQTPADVALRPQDEIHLELEGYSSHVLKIGQNATEIHPLILVSSAFGILGAGLGALGLSLFENEVGDFLVAGFALVPGVYFMVAGFGSMAVDMLFGNVQRVALNEISIQLKQDDKDKSEGGTGD